MQEQPGGPAALGRVAAPITWSTRGSASWGKAGGNRGEHEGLLTLDGEGWQTAGNGQPWRPARSARGGGAPALRR
jgi:hypothetical protein